jgi:hypothetical protein
MLAECLVSLSWLFMRSFNDSATRVLLLRLYFFSKKPRERSPYSTSAKGQDDRRIVVRFRVWRGDFSLFQLPGCAVHPVSHLICAAGVLHAGKKWLVCEDEHSSPSSKGTVAPEIDQEDTKGEKLQLYTFFNLGVRWGLWLRPRSGRLPPRKRPSTHCTGGWINPRDGLDGCGKARPHVDSFSGPSSPWPDASICTTQAKNE